MPAETRHLIFAKGGATALELMADANEALAQLPVDSSVTREQVARELRTVAMQIRADAELDSLAALLNDVFPDGVIIQFPTAPAEDGGTDNAA
jgi:hypothetical protein